jgi:ABC-type amino acid transport substrate-binding protein
MKKMKKFLALMLAMLMALSLVACGGGNNAADDNNANNGGDDAAMTKLVLGTSADYAPFEFMYPDESGEMVYGGIDVSVAQYIADEMGVELQVENMGFDYLLTSLDKGDFDIVLAAMEATPDRLENADFSDPYYTDVPPAILVKADKADQYKTLADFNGKSIGAQTATTKLDMVNEMEGVNPVALQSVLDLVNELVYDKVDAILVDGGVAKQYAEANPDLVIADASAELGEPAPYCVAVQKGDPKGLLPAINAAIAKMNEANTLETFIADADSLADVAVEVSAN